MGAVFIGYRGENAVREIKIPVSHLTSEFPGMTVCMSMVPVGGSDDDAYLLDTTLEGDHLIWHVQAADVVASGTTKAAVRLVDGSGRVALDHPFEVFISSNIGASGEMPDVYIPWIDRLAAAAARAEEAAERADEAAGNFAAGLDDKLDKGGYTPNMFLGTDEDGNVIEKEAPEGGGGGIANETDPTVPAWAKEPHPPTYTREDIGLGNVENVLQYSAKNPPPYPVSKVNGKTGEVTLSAADVGALPASTTVPTSTSQLTNNSGFITNTVSDLTKYYLKSETYTQQEINQRISAIPKFSIAVVDSLPTSNISETTIYLTGGGISGNLYTEYIRVNGAWEILGSQRVDMDGYATQEWVSQQLGTYLKASELTAAINTALEQAAASGEFDGVGVDSVSVTRSPDENGFYYIVLTLTDGQQEVIPYKNGADGNGIASAVLNADYTLTLNFTDGTSYTTPSIRGDKGADGVSIASVQQTTTSAADGGTNVVTVTLSNGQKATFEVKNGKQGSKGDKGDPGDSVKGDKGDTGDTGATGQRGFGVLKITTAPSSYTTATGGFTPTYRVSLSTVKSQAKVDAVLVGDTVLYSYYTYPVGYVDASYVYLGTRVSIRGTTGAAGAAGVAGYTPIRGTDYWTPSDQEEIVQQVITALGTPVFGTVDENNVITLTGALENGAYTLLYEDADGNVLEIGMLSLTDDGPIDIPWVEGYTAGGSSGTTNTPQDGYMATEKIPVEAGYEYTLQTLSFPYISLYVYYYDANGGALGRNTDESLASDADNSNKSVVLSPKAGAVAFKLQSYCGVDRYDVVRNNVTITRRYVG